ncbi:MAG: SDR family oxidoreductase [Chitinophagales bacterium]|nr:SDR family oxidoreductase [Chitinophagales bacterium]
MLPADHIRIIINNNTDKLEYSNKYHKGELGNLSFLITGGAGFIGSHIVEYLLNFGAAKVRVLDNLVTGSYENIEAFTSNPAFEFVEGDIRDIETCKSAMSEIDFVSHQAAIGSVPRSIIDPVFTNSVNVDGFVNVITAAKEAVVKRFVFASSSSVYGDEESLPKVEENIGNQLSPYAVSKYANELYADVFSRTYGMECIGLRYFNVFGPRQDPAGQYAAVIPRFIEQLLSGQDVYIDGDGKQTRDFTFVENAVQMNIRSMFTDNDDAINTVYNVACGEKLSINELFKNICKLTASSKAAIYKDVRPGDIKHSLADISKAENFLDYASIIFFKEGIEKTIDSFAKQYMG